MGYTNLKPIDLKKIKVVDFPQDHYFQEEFTKTQIVLHHTVASPNSAIQVIKEWYKKPSHVATAFVIDGDGTPYQVFSSKYWAYHLGLQQGTFDKNGVPYKPIDKTSIGVEINNWGGLIAGDDVTIKNFGTQEHPENIKLKKGYYYTAYGNALQIPDNQITYFPNGFRDFKYFQNYTDAQLETVGELLLFWKNKYGIPLTYNEDMWDVSKKALEGTSGIWTHVSFRYDKSDCFIYQPMIDMLKSL